MASMTEKELSHGHYSDPSTSVLKMLSVKPQRAGDKAGVWYVFAGGWKWCDTANVSHIEHDCQVAPGVQPKSDHLGTIISSAGPTASALAQKLAFKMHWCGLQDDHNDSSTPHECNATSAACKLCTCTECANHMIVVAR